MPMQVREEDQRSKGGAGRTIPALLLVLLAALPHTAAASGLGELRRNFLAAETLADTGFPQEVMERNFYILLGDVIREDPELAAPIVLHTDRLILGEERREGGGWFKGMWNGWTHVGSYLQKFEEREESLDAIGVIIRSYREDDAGRIPYTGWGRDASRFALFGHFLAAGGNYDTAGAMDRLIPDLRLACGEGEFVYFAPHILELADFLRPRQRRDLAAWAARLSREADLTLSAIGEATALGLALYEKAQGVAVDHPELIRGLVLEARLLEILRDETLSPAWRGGFTALMGLQFRDELSPELRIEIGKLLARVLREEIPMAGSSFAYAIAAFLRGDDSDQAWRTTGEDLLKAWEARNEWNDLPRTKGRALNPSRDWIVPVTELAGRVGTKEQLRSHLEEFREEPYAAPGMWVSLVKTGHFDLAKDVQFGECLDAPFRSDHFRHDNTYDATLARAVPGYLASLSDPAERIFSELLLAAVVDPASPQPDPAETTQQERFAAFAEKHESLPDWQGKKQVRALEVFSLSLGNPGITRWLTERQIGLEARIQLEEPEFSAYWAARIELHAAIEELEAGMTLPTQFVWGRVVADRNPVIADHRNHLAEAVIDMIDGRIRLACQRGDREGLEKYLLVGRQLLETAPEQVYRPDVLRFSIRVLAAHALCDQMAEWHRWWDALTPLRRRHLASLQFDGENRRLISSLEELLEGWEFRSDADRRRSFREILSSEWVDRSYSGYSCLATATARGLLDERDLFEIAEAVAVAAPRSGSAWREYFGSLADGGRLSEALARSEEILLQEDEDSPLAAVVEVERWRMLEGAGRTEEARSLGEALSRREVELPREYGATLRGLEKR